MLSIEIMWEGPYTLDQVIRDDDRTIGDGNYATGDEARVSAAGRGAELEPVFDLRNQGGAGAPGRAGGRRHEPGQSRLDIPALPLAVAQFPSEIMPQGGEPGVASTRPPTRKRRPWPPSARPPHCVPRARRANCGTPPTTLSQ